MNEETRRALHAYTEGVKRARAEYRVAPSTHRNVTGPCRGCGEPTRRLNGWCSQKCEER